MKRIMLHVAYDGTKYHGYQIQDGPDTIEGELLKALTSLTSESGIELIGGSRTDAGVHALDNVCVFDTEASIPPEKYIFALNQRLPEDIRITESCEVDPAFHPRHCDSVKTYEYHIHTGKVPNPLKSRYSYYTYYSTNIQAMRDAAAYIVGEHDFSAFCAAGAQVDSKIRTIYSCDIIINPTSDDIPKANSESSSDDITGTDSRPETDIIIRISGNGFLYNMVRIIAGTLLEVGRGHIASEDVKDIIASMDRTKAGPTAPALGLVLKKYDFV
ncbi:MAG: tRNA pseudouridine(38-40) synthase TruA [Lachnospiraceae bacterium]|nr:tRNA pseudouridine(38-40) synthase TruA [Lachnospiraceae bacterium]